MRNPFDTKFYISEKGYQGVIDFKYKGGSSSILYEHIWSPLCNWIVDNLIPDSIAPNTITLFASLQFIATHMAVMWYSPDFQSPIPTPLIVWVGISTLLYQILDNCDGKQARKTGSSSPLGMLFDHGCDSCITWVMCLTMFNVVQLGQNSISYFTAIIISQIAFYMAQWSQYHCGVFKLGYINAVDEGLVLIECTFFFTAIFGQEFWSQVCPPLMELRYNEICMIGTMFTAIIQILAFVYDTLKEIENKCSVLRSLTSVVWLLISYSLVYYFAPTGFIEQYGLYVHYGFAALFSKVTLQIQIAHLTEEDFKQMTFSYVFITLFMVVSFGINSMVNVDDIYSAKIILFTMLAMAFISYLHIIICVSHHISSILGIRVFSLTKPEDKQFAKFSNEVEMYNSKL